MRLVCEQLHGVGGNGHVGVVRCNSKGRGFQMPKSFHGQSWGFWARDAARRFASDPALRVVDVTSPGGTVRGRITRED